MSKVVDWVLVQPPFRRRDLARELCGAFVTHDFKSNSSSTGLPHNLGNVRNGEGKDF